jgi:hypothetical protein
MNTNLTKNPYLYNMKHTIQIDNKNGLFFAVLDGGTVTGKHKSLKTLFSELSGYIGDPVTVEDLPEPEDEIEWEEDSDCERVMTLLEVLKCRSGNGHLIRGDKRERLENKLIELTDRL